MPETQPQSTQLTLDSDVTVLSNTDAGALGTAYSLMSNRQLGFGDHRDKTKAAQVNQVNKLLLTDRINLFRGSMIVRRAVETLPKTAGRVWLKWTFGSSKRAKSDKFDDYFKTLGFRKALVQASIEARHHGEGYILLGINDGLDWSQPVNELGIRSVIRLKVLTAEQVFPDIQSGVMEPEYFRVYTRSTESELRQNQLIHKSRIIRMVGRSLTGDALIQTSGRHDSVIQTLYEAFTAWHQGLMAGSGMLVDYNIFTYGLSGLAQLSQDPAGAEKVLNRFLTMQLGASVNKGIAHDAEFEKIGFTNRTYSGADKIMEQLLESMVAAQELPRSKLLGTAAKSGLGSENRGEQDRMEFASIVHDYVENDWREPIEYMLRLAMAAADGPTRGKPIAGASCAFNSALELSDLEKVELKDKTMDMVGKAKSIGLIRETEGRQCFEGAEFTHEIVLNPDISQQIEDESIMNLEEKADRDREIAVKDQAIMPKPATGGFNKDAVDRRKFGGVELTGSEFEQLSSISAADWLAAVNGIQDADVES